MPFPFTLPLRRMGIFAAALWLVACSSPPPEPPKAPVLLSKEQAALRSIVPFTRPVSLDKAGPIVEVEFELPSPEANSVPILMIGLRVSGATAKEMRATSTFVTAEPLHARVILHRVVAGESVPVRLVRSGRSLAEIVEVDALGNIPRLTITSVDDNPLHEAGLLDESRFYDILMFAEMEKAVPGRYRLSIENISDHPRLRRQDVELLVAYNHKVK